MMNKRTRGFAAMDPEKQRAIASKGGKAAHAKGTAHRFTPAEASEAGRKGGRAAHARGTAHRFTTEEASKAGRKGGSSRSSRHHQSGEAEGEERTEASSGGAAYSGLAGEPFRHDPHMLANERSISEQPGSRHATV